MLDNYGWGWIMNRGCKGKLGSLKVTDIYFALPMFCSKILLENLGTPYQLTLSIPLIIHPSPQASSLPLLLPPFIPIPPINLDPYGRVYH